MGEVLIAGTASLLICVFLSPKFIDFLREREFGQQIREEGPSEHHAKAGTPTMGGIIIFTAIAVPFLLLTDRDPRSLAVFGVAVACALLGFADDYTKLVKRRSLGLRGRTKLIITMLISIGLWIGASQGADLGDTLNLRIVDARIDLGYLYPVLIYLVVAGTTSASRRAAPRSSCWPTSRSPSRQARRTSRSWRGVWSAPASASCGSTRSRPRSSWATRDHSASAARSRRWR
jgi:phospho-N-acetylmuramoyl-pentapeptide-transferase